MDDPKCCLTDISASSERPDFTVMLTFGATWVFEGRGGWGFTFIARFEREVPRGWDFQRARKGVDMGGWRGREGKGLLFVAFAVVAFDVAGRGGCW